MDWTGQSAGGWHLGNPHGIRLGQNAEFRPGIVGLEAGADGINILIPIGPKPFKPTLPAGLPVFDGCGFDRCGRGRLRRMALAGKQGDPKAGIITENNPVVPTLGVSRAEKLKIVGDEGGAMSGSPMIQTCCEVLAIAA